MPVGIHGILDLIRIPNHVLIESQRETLTNSIVNLQCHGFRDLVHVNLWVSIDDTN